MSWNDPLEMEHFRFSFLGERKDLPRALELACSNIGSEPHAAHAWKVEGGRLILFWTAADAATIDATALPAPLSPQALFAFVDSWLDATEPARPQYEGDGTSTIGVHVYNERWGHVAGHWQSFAAIEPAWLYYGK